MGDRLIVLELTGWNGAKTAVVVAPGMMVTADDDGATLIQAAGAMVRVRESYDEVLDRLIDEIEQGPARG